jgi:hypothetical protein
MGEKVNGKKLMANADKHASEQAGELKKQL